MSYSKQNFRSGDTLYASQLNAMDDEIAVLEAEVESTKNMVGSPLTASTAAGMTDQTKIYVYTGSETGYTAGHWYYYNGTAWTDGGVYNSVAVNTDTSLRVSGQAADSKAVGDAIDEIDGDLTDVKSDLKNKQDDITRLKKASPEVGTYDGNNGFAISDYDGNVVVELENGHLKTKHFNSRNNRAYVCQNEKGYMIIVDDAEPLNVYEMLFEFPYNSSGYSSFKFTHAGKNLFDIENSVPTYVGTVASYTKNGGTLIVTGGYVGFALFKITKSMVNKHFVLSANVENGGTLRTVAFRTRTDWQGSNPSLHISSSWIGWELGIIFTEGTYSNIQLEISTSSGTQYEPYSGCTYEVNLPSDFYGGYVDAISGKGQKKYDFSGNSMSQDVTISPVDLYMKTGYNFLCSEQVIDLKYYTDAKKIIDAIVTKPSIIKLHDPQKIKYCENGFAYTAFSGGCILGGSETYVSRYAIQHTTPLSHAEWGKLGFVRRTVSGVFTDVIFPELGYATLYGELRDPNLSNIDQTKAFLSGFATNNDGETPVYYNYLYVIDSDLNAIDRLVYETDKLFWGNTFITPNGYLLHCAYDADNLYLMRSTTAFSGTVNDLEFEIVQTIENGGNESTIGRWNEKLVIIARNNTNGQPSNLYESDGLEGTGTFTSHSLTFPLHSPVMNLVNSGKHLIIAGGRMMNPKRKPYVVTIRENFSVEDYGCVFETEGYGGYPTLVRIDAERYGMVFYDEDDAGGTVLYFSEVNLNYCLNTSYHPL